MAKLLNNLRSWYASAPPSTQDKLGSLISLLPSKYIYGQSFFDVQRDIKRSNQDCEFTKEIQLKKLRELISHANKAPYYQELFSKTYGGIPDIDNFTFEDLVKLPILTKNELRSDPEAFLTKPLSEVDISSTSGSSGHPLKFFLDKDRGVREFAYITHFWSQIGFEVGKHKRAVFRGVHLDNVDQKPWRYDSALRELRLSPFHFKPDNMAQFFDLIEKYKIDYIHGYPSSIVVFANHVINTGWKPPKSLKGILPVSEATLPHQIAAFEKAFPDAKIMKYYGMSEKVLIGGQVGNDYSTYDLEPLYGYGELIDENQQIITEKGKQGHIVGTGFISMAMPLLRYDTEDAAELVALPTADNNYRMRLHNVQGRWGEEYALGTNNELTSMSAINIHSEVYAKLHMFQLFQDKKGFVTIKVVPHKGVSSAELQPFRDEIQGKVGDSIQFELQVVEDIPFNTSNGKRTFIDQKIDLTPYLRGEHG